jgi:hypothetical protein
MTKSTLILVLALLLAALFVAALGVWAFWVRPYVRRLGRRTASPHTLAALVADFGTGMVQSHGRLPGPLQVMGLLLMLIASDLILILLVAWLSR